MNEHLDEPFDKPLDEPLDEIPSTLPGVQGTLEPAVGDRPKIKLDQFLKLKNLVGSGGEAKGAIQTGQVQVNGEIETRRGRKLEVGDRVTFSGYTFTVEA